MALKKITILIFLAFTIFTGFAYAQDAAEQKKSDLSNKIQEYEKKLTELRGEKNSLSSQIQLMDTQISLTAFKIQDTEKRVISTQKEIELLDSKIDGLDDSLDYLSKLLVQRVVHGYKMRTFSFFDIVFNTANAAEMINEFKYAKTTRDNNQKLLVQVQTTKVNFEEQKKMREKKKEELAILEDTLVNQKADLDKQKSQKQLLLADTQSDERKYQQLLNQALAEFNAVQQAVLTGAKVGPVKKGEPIALVGNSGAPYCSSGAHLHFEVRVNDSWVDPAGYLTSKTLTDHQTGGSSTIGTGSWDWPLTDPIIVEQHFGHTPWSWRYGYSGGIHTGIDMWSSGSEVIRAPADGTLYSSSQNCSGATINIKYIDHGNGVKTFFLHVQ
jgi:peptidoglycan hydrolase CwlO-like protein